MTGYSWITQPNGHQLYCFTDANGNQVSAGDYQSRRAGMYPDLPDQVDALWKIVMVIQAGGAPSAWPADALAVLDARNAVKAAIPKPDIAPPWVK